MGMKRVEFLKLYQGVKWLLLAGVLFFAIGIGPLSAATVGPDDARQVVTGWLTLNPRPFTLGNEPSVAGPVQTFTDEQAEPVYYVVELSPSGFVIVGADDRIEPIVAFVETGSYDPSPEKPLGAIIATDLPGRIEALRSLDTSPSARLQSASDPDSVTLADIALDAQQRWSDLLDANQPVATLMGLSSLSNVWVEPLLSSTWGQTTVGDYIGGLPCYNYYTPNNYPCGCTATAMAQIMRLHQYPTSYAWSNMPLQPNPASATLTQRQTIGDLCADAAYSIGTSFGASGSSADIGQVPDAFTGTFGYSNAIVTDFVSSTQLQKEVNCNLDAAMPVIIGVDGSVGGHAVVCDGYGYSGSTLYHHLNMGWSGQYNAWYALPYVDSSPYFTQITTCVYNVYESGSGEIISGRVTDMGGNGIPGVYVSTNIGSYVYADLTDNQGVYAIRNLPSNRSCTVVASKSPHVFANRTASTGRSTDWGTCGNVWGINFASTTAGPPTAFDQTVTAYSGVALTVTLTSDDDGLPNPPGYVQYRIVSAPAHGRLIDPATGEITAFPHTLASNGHVVRYQPCSYYSGSDAFDFVADDGGTAPSGGESSGATVTVDVQNTVTTTFAPEDGWYAKWPMRTSYHDSRTQVIYLSSEIGDAKNITDLALDVVTVPALPLNNWTIRMKHTSMSSYGTFDIFQTTGWTTVFRGTVTVTSEGWCNFHFTTPFSYNGSSNLMVDFSHESSTWASPPGECSVSPMGAERVVMAYADSTYGDPLNWSNSFFPADCYGSEGVPNIQLQGSIEGTPIEGDFSVDCRVGAPDLAMLADAWLSDTGETTWDSVYDISPIKDGRVNYKDFAAFVDKWLAVSQ